MCDGARRALTTAFALLFPSCLLAAPAVNVGTVVEKGFRSHTTACFEITQPQGLGWIVQDAACSPGPAWGPYIYVNLSNAFDPFAFGGIVRIDSRGKITDTGMSASVPRGIAFSSAGGPWGDRLWQWADQPATTLPPVTVAWASDYTPAGSSCSRAQRFVFDRSGDFGYALYTADPAGIVRMTDPNDCTPDVVPPISTPNYELFSSAPATPVAFGPGGAWGTSLYAAPGTVVQPDGTFASFGFSFGNLTWGGDPATPSWGGDMFARLSGGNAGDIYRVDPNGTSSLFATDIPGALVFCNGSLWVIANGACTEIAATGPGDGGKNQPRFARTPSNRFRRFHLGVD